MSRFNYSMIMLIGFTLGIVAASASFASPVPAGQVGGKSGKSHHASGTGAISGSDVHKNKR